MFYCMFLCLLIIQPLGYLIHYFWVHFDSVMVLDSGLISEYDSPTNLLSNQKSTFYSMAEDAGLV